MYLQSVLPSSFFLWCQHTWIGQYEAETLWAFALLETFHLMALTVLLGTLLVVDLRVLGLGMIRQPAVQLAKELMPFTLCALATIIATGVPMFMYEAVRLSTSSAFSLKMVLLLMSIIIHFGTHKKQTISTGNEGTTLRMLSACASLLCWLGVALAGRAIA